MSAKHAAFPFRTPSPTPRALQALVPSPRRKLIASGPPTPGVVMDTKGPVETMRHMTWWIPNGVTPSGNFQTQSGGP